MRDRGASRRTRTIVGAGRDLPNYLMGRIIDAPVQSAAGKINKHGLVVII